MGRIGCCVHVFLVRPAEVSAFSCVGDHLCLTRHRIIIIIIIIF